MSNVIPLPNAKPKPGAESVASFLSRKLNPSAPVVGLGRYNPAHEAMPATTVTLLAQAILSKADLDAATLLANDLQIDDEVEIARRETGRNAAKSRARNLLRQATAIGLIRGSELYVAAETAMREAAPAGSNLLEAATAWLRPWSNPAA